NEATYAYFTTLFSGASWSTTMTPLVASVLVLGALTQVLPTRWFEALETRYDAGSLAFKVALPFAVIFLISVAAPSGMAPFIYFKFWGGGWGTVSTAKGTGGRGGCVPHAPPRSSSTRRSRC